MSKAIFPLRAAAHPVRDVRPLACVVDLELREELAAVELANESPEDALARREACADIAAEYETLEVAA